MKASRVAPPVDVLWRRFREDGDASARAELLEQHLGLVHHVARGIAGRVGDALSYDDLVSAGTIGLVQALEGFDAGRGHAFTTYATQRIRGAVLDELRAADWRPRSVRARGRMLTNATVSVEARLGRRARPAEVAAELDIDVTTYFEWRGAFEGGVTVSLDGDAAERDLRGVSLAERIPDDQAQWPDLAMVRDEQADLLRQEISRLPKQQRVVLTLSYYEELTLRQIAEVLHLTESRISQIRTAGLRTLRSCLRQEHAA